MGGLQTSVNSQPLILTTETTNGDIVNFTVNSIPKICDDIQIIRWSEEKKKYPHLADLPLEDTGGRIDVLLGLENADLIIGTDWRATEGSHKTPPF